MSYTSAQLLGDGISKAGDVSHITGVYIVDDQGTKYNIFKAFKEIAIYEDIFSPCISGTVLMVDIQNFITNIPIIGDETLELEYVTPSMSDPIKKTFFITKVDSKTQGGDKKLVYTIHFTSPEAVYDLETKISRAYSGNAQEIVREICKKELELKDEDIDIEDADNKIKFVSPWWSPFKCIAYATSRCLLPNSKITTPNYLFYQTLRSYKLKSLTSLFGQAPYSSYFFDANPMRDKLPDGRSTTDITRQYQTVLSLDWTASQDRIKNILDGAISNTVFGVNLLRKEFTNKGYRIEDDFSKTKHLDDSEISPLSVGLSKFETRVTAPQCFDGVNDVADDIISKRIPLLAQLELFKLDLVVHGRTDVEVGMTIEFLMNTYITKDAESSGNPKTHHDPYYSGKYLITAIQHRLDQFSHQMVMQVVKESSLSQLVYGVFDE